MADKPQFSDNPLYELLRQENVEEFNKQIAAGKTVDLRGLDMRGLDLRGINFDGMDLSNAYFRGTDLRGVDFRNTNLEGASMASAKISGCYFPKQLSTQEINLSLKEGIRMRYDKD